jgi:methyltransferase (TIGR00027 family)
MKKEKPSSSAEMVAAVRATESMRPTDEQVCYDPFAKDFLGLKFTFISKSRLLTKIALWKAERTDPGAVGCVASRTRYIDDYLQECIDDGIKQLVILGAGYDSRAYRFDDLKGKVKVFELDHPATQKVKIERIKKIFGSIPNHVIYIPIDFGKEKFDNRLFESEYNKNLKTLFIWEGVTMYITAEAVDETLSFVVNNSGKGSSIIFNYIFQSVIDGTCELEGAEKIAKSYERRGEPLSFGIEEGTIDEFLSERGFYQVKNVTGEFFKSEYFKGKNQNRKVCCLCGFVHATVNPKNKPA